MVLQTEALMQIYSLLVMNPTFTDFVDTLDLGLRSCTIYAFVEKITQRYQLW